MKESALSPQIPADAITASDDGYVVDAVLVAKNLDLTPAFFIRELKRGIVYSVVEGGEGEDAGRVRLTFRYRTRSWSVTLEAPASGSGHGA